MKVCLLGGGNPHALAMVRYFIATGIDCFGIGRAPAKPAPLWLVPKGYRYHWVGSDDLPRLLTLLDVERPDVIVSLLAQGEGAASFGADAWRFYQTNCVYLARIVEELRHCDWLKRFVQIGTSELYGSCDHPVAEDSPYRPSSPYAVSKAAFDQHLQIMHRVHGFPMQIVRPSNCLCVGQQLHRIVPRAAICAVYGQKLQLHGGGLAKKSFLDSEDLARAVLAVIERGAIGEIYNAGPLEPTPIREVVRCVADRADVPMEKFVEETTARVGEDSTYWLDSSRLRALGWKPRVTLSVAIERIVDWARAYPELAHMPHEYSVTP